jgi:hypothetical protein
MAYIVEYGLQSKTQALAIGGLKLQIAIQWLPVIGVLFVALVALYDVILRIFPRRTGPEVDPLGNARFIRVIAFSVMAFACVLYIPYILGSNWFWARVGEVSRNIPQLRSASQSLLNGIQQFMTMDQLWQYTISQVLAAAALVFVGWFFARTRRVRKLR